MSSIFDFAFQESNNQGAKSGSTKSDLPEKPEDEAHYLHEQLLGFKANPLSACSTDLAQNLHDLQLKPADYISLVGANIDPEAGSELPTITFKKHRGKVEIEPRKNHNLDEDKVFAQLNKDLQKKSALSIDSSGDYYFSDAMHRAYANNGTCGVAQFVSVMNERLVQAGSTYQLVLHNIGSGSMAVNVESPHKPGVVLHYNFNGPPLRDPRLNKQSDVYPPQIDIDRRPY